MSLHYHKCFKISEKRTKGQTMMYKVQHRKRIIYIEKFEDTKGVIRSRISKKNRQHNGQRKKYKRTNNDLQNIHIKLKIE
jgi:hypothetical protein